MQKISLLITDLDNTLFDWVEIWYRPFRAMLDVLVEQSGVPEHVLTKDIKAVFRKHKTTEYAFVIEEIGTLRDKHPDQNLAELYADAITAFRSARRKVLHLYPTVQESLREIKRLGCRVVGYTESFAFYTNYRIRRLELDGLLDVVYSPPDHEMPEGLTRDQIRYYADEKYRLKKTDAKFTPRGAVKPNAELLLKIVDEQRANRHEVAYVGDNLMKDVLMAKEAEITDVWAEYGFASNRPEYELLREVTHWSDNAVKQEKELHHSQVEPTHILTDTFSEVLREFEFIRFST